MPFIIVNEHLQESSGGSDPQWKPTSKGKVWKERQHVSNHIRLVMDNHERYVRYNPNSPCVCPYHAAGVEVVEVKVTHLGHTPLVEWIDNLNRKYRPQKNS